MIHEEFWSPDWLTDFPSGNLVSLICIISLVFKLLFSSRVGIISYQYHITQYRFDQVWS